VKRSGKIAAVAALTGLLVALGVVLFGAPVAAAEGLTPAERRAQESVLRLDELPAGYALGEDFYCGSPPRPSEDEGIYEREEHKPPAPYEAFLDRYDPTTCFFGYEQIYRPAGEPAGPLTVYAFTLATPSVAAATEGLAPGKVSNELASWSIGVEGLYPAGTAPALGEAALSFHTNLFHSYRRTHLAGTLVLWRSGKLIAGIFAGGAQVSVNDAAAAHYAALQQALVEAPRPYEESEAESIPTYFGNPDLHVPVYWLGKEFKPGERSGTSYFLSASAGRQLEHPETGMQLSVQYNTELFVDSWTPGGWRRFSKTEVGRRQWTWHCTRSQTVRLPEGHAVIYASYRTGYKACPDFPPKHFSAHVFLPGAVIAIGEPRCRYCQGFLSPQFDSFRAMKAIVHGLRRWRGDAG
jgi:hypothetical protein